MLLARRQFQIDFHGALARVYLQFMEQRLDCCAVGYLSGLTVEDDVHVLETVLTKKGE